MPNCWKPRAVVLAALIAMPLGADVTLRYKTEMKLNPTLPPQMAEPMTKGMAHSLPPESSIQLKEGKGYSSFGAIRSICDFTRQQITVLDTNKKQYATGGLDALSDEMGKILGGMPPEARAAMASMKVAAESKMTGRTATIMGVEGEEREVVMTVSGPAMPGAPPGPLMKMVLQFWTAKAGEAMRVPAIRELTGYNLWAYATMNPVSSMEKMFKQIPGMGEGMVQTMKELQSARAAVLRTHSMIFMPAVAAMMKQMPADKNPFGAGFDAEAPVLEMTQELAEMSTAPISDKVFEIPEGYTTAPLGEVMKGMIPKPTTAPKP